MIDRPVEVFQEKHVNADQIKTTFERNVKAMTLRPSIGSTTA
jgi:hypothetical protein